MKNGNGKHARFKLHTDTIALIEGLSQAEYGQVAAYSALSEMIGRDVQKEAGYVLRSALNILERDYGMFFSCVTGEGVMRITESEHVISAPKKIADGIHNRAIKGQKTLMAVRPGKLSREEETKRLQDISNFGTLAAFTEKKPVVETPKKVQAPANADKKALELFPKKN